jgi:serine/threonine protein kinase
MVSCPYCGFLMEVVGMKVGRYTPACQQCRKKFLIVVPEPVVKTWEEAVAELREGRMVEIGEQALRDAGVLPGAVGGNAAKERAEVIAGPAHSVAVAATVAPRAEVRAGSSGTAVPGEIGPMEPAHGARHVREHAGHGGGHATQPGPLHGGNHGHGETQHRENHDHPRAAPPPKAAPLEMPDMPEMLGGYKIEKKLGEGGMGAVYLARQLSLDRPVAVKVMNRMWAKDADFIARFTREAYAAAQLTHHNVVQIHDIGVEGDVHFFSMEYVPGKSLAALVKEQKRLDPEEAAGYALQAARGLKFAHDHGMIHRDIKPENLLLNEQGIVKVMDLGLVKTPGTSESETKPRAEVAGMGAEAGSAGTTQANVSMGTPLYMSPEQAQDAAGVDARADVYSLGCTLYDFVVGRPPFEGKTAMEVLTKHAREPVVPPEKLVHRVPHGLSEIVRNMVAKKKEERIESMEGVIHALEHFLGISSAGPFTPKEEHAKILELAVKRFSKSPLAGLRRNLIRLLFALGVLGVAVCVLMGMPRIGGAVLGLMVLTPVFYEVMIGITRRTHVFTRVRQLAFGARIVDWFKFGAMAFSVVAVLWIFGLLWVWIVVAVAAVGIAGAFAFGLDVAVRRERKPEVDRVQAMLRAMRLKGLEEERLRQFVCKYAENQWEEFYEALFGYESKMHARALWGRGEAGQERKKFGAWRDGIVRWAEGRIARRKVEREERLLERLEEKRLRSKGASESEAKRKAKEAAEWIVGQAASVKEEKWRRVAETVAAPGHGAAAAPVPGKGKLGLAFGHEPTEAEMAAAKRERARVSASRTFGGGVGMMLLGPQVRLGLGVLAIFVCLLWLNQNHALNAERVRGIVLESFEGGYAKIADPWKGRKVAAAAEGERVIPRKMEALWVPGVSARLTAEQQEKLLNRLTWGIAGILLVISSLWRGVRMSFLILPAVVGVIAGELLGVPGVMGFAVWQVASLAGVVLALGAYWFGREVGA